MNLLVPLNPYFYYQNNIIKYTFAMSELKDNDKYY